MSLRPSEEQLTAYVMDELTTSERAAVEAALAADPELRAEAEALRGLCAALWSELQTEPLPTLGAAKKAALVRALDLTGDASPSPSRSRSRWLMAAPLVAAAAAAVFMLYPRFDRRHLTPESSKTEASNAASEVRFVPADGGNEPAPVAEVEKAKPASKLAQVARQPQVEFKGQADTSQRHRGPALAEKSRLAAPFGSGGALSLSDATPMGKLRSNGARGLPQGEPMEGAQPQGEFNTEAYGHIQENPFRAPAEEALSTFSIDADTASYANVRRFLDSGSLPPKDAVRIEELVNYFPYSYKQPDGDRPFAVDVEVNEAPWAKDHRLVRIGLSGKDVAWSEAQPSNLVFLVDVSGSMNEPRKLPLLKQALKLLVDKLTAKDKVAVVVYAGNTGLVLPPTAGSEKTRILAAIDGMGAGGSTNGGAGLKLAYQTAVQGFVKGGINRVILATDGDWNVGVTNQGDLVRLIQDEAKSGVFLSVLGFGMGNYKDSTLEQLADKGHGNYAYIDTLNEARKVLVEEIGGTLLTIAKDVKIQVEFNPAEVTAWRLIGYENRLLAHQDFNDDKKDAGDIGSGHKVTALYEVVPKGVALPVPGVDALKYQQPKAASGAAASGELMTLKLRYKAPAAATSSLIEYAVKDQGGRLGGASDDFRFAAAVAEFGLVLRGSEHKGSATLSQVLSLGEGARGEDKGGYRREFLELVRKAQGLGAK